MTTRKVPVSGSVPTTLTPEDIEAISAKIQAVRATAAPGGKRTSSKATPELTEFSADALVSVLEELATNMKTAASDSATAKQALSVIETERNELKASLDEATQQVTQLKELNTQLTERVSELQVSAKAATIAFEAGELRTQAKALVAAQKMLPADYADIFGKDDEEFAEQVKAMAEDAEVFAFASTYVARIAKFASPAGGKAVDLNKIEVVEPRLPKETAGGKSEVAAKAAAMVAQRYVRK